MSAEKTLDRIIYKRLQRLFIITLICLSVCYLAGFVYLFAQVKKVESNYSIQGFKDRPTFLSIIDRPEPTEVPVEESPDQKIITTLNTSIANWQVRLDTLKQNIQKVQEKKQSPSAIEPYFKDYINASKTTIDQIKALNFHPDIQPQINEVYKIENSYLQQIQSLSSNYDNRTDQISESLKAQLILSCFLGVLLITIAYYLALKPSAKYISRIIKQLLTLNKNAQEKVRRADILTQEKQETVKALQTLNTVMEQSLLYTRLDPQGYIISAGSKFSRFFNFNPNDPEVQFSTLIAKEERDQEYINNIIHTHKNTGWQGEIKGSDSQGEPRWFEISINPYHNENNNEALLVICFDITERKKAQNQISKLTKDHFESEMDRQKELSSKIIESQEKEQNRIAKDIHDGIGQMLTGLKFTIESIDPNNIESTNKKIEQLKELSAEIIIGVRTATFNLSPPELVDYGIAASLTNLSQELSKFTGKEILTINKTDFNSRLDPLVEINIYRIVQEAVNNAIKYAESSHIVITISHSEDMLSIVVDDNGKGFDLDAIATQEEHGGMGLTFMKERIAYINGRLYISSSEKVGTRVTINIPLLVDLN